MSVWAGPGPWSRPLKCIPSSSASTASPMLVAGQHFVKFLGVFSGPACARMDVLRLARECLACTASKTTRHILSPLVHRPVPGARFSSLHSDLVGPLPPSEGFRYLLTVIDRSTRQVEVIPLADMTATALLLYWISCFGVPVDITTDQGRQFTSSLCSEPHQLLESPLCGLRRTIHSQTGWWRESIE